MIRLISLLPIPKFINEQPEWWTDMSVDQQKQYLSTYKKSKHKIVPQNPSGKEERETGVGVKHNVKPWSDENYKEEASEVKLNLPDFQNKSEEEAEKALRDTDRVKSRQLEPDEIKNMSNSEAGLAQEYMNDDSGQPDEFGDTDKEEKVKNLINYQNFEDEGQRWEYTQKAKDEFGEENLPRYDNSKGDEAYDAPENHESFKKFKKIKDNPEYVKKYEGGEAGGKWRNIDGLIDAFKKGSSIPSNLVAQDKEGNTQLVGGNTRFVAAIGAGVNPITKVMNVDNVTKNESIKVEEGIILEYSKFKLRIPSDIRKIHKLFKKNKKKLFVVGGAVRDAILGKNPKDFDLATDAKPDEVLKIAKKGGLKTVEVGKQFGVVIVNGHEIATFRKDIGKGRRPSSVDYTDIEGDVKRRDLTINALFYDMDRGEIVDLVGGIADLKKKKIRTVGKPIERFDEDPLRKMRALRFQGALGGKLGKETEKALRQNPSLKGVSKERIRDEFVKSIRKAKSTKRYLQLADSLGFTKQILPGFQVKVPYINENDYVLFLAWILRKNDVNSIRKLNGLAYHNQEIVDIQFLNSLQNFKPENIFLIKKFQEKTKLSKGQILKWGKYIGKDFKKLVRFKLSVKGSDVPSDLKGKDIGKAIQNMEKDKFLNEKEEYTFGPDWIPTSLGQRKKMKRIHKKLNRSIREIAVRKKPKKFKDIYNALPSDLKKRVYNLKNYEQRRDHHPEGNVLKHTIAVTNRALKTGDIDFALAALFHDIGKDETAKLHPKKGFWTHYGHEKVSAKLVKKYAKWIKSMGGNVLDIYYIVKQHMRMKVFDKMKWHKQQKLKQFRAFDKLKKFSRDFDKGGRR
jgi:putative nucleotidyltransferase with HDIG domain